MNSLSKMIIYTMYHTSTAIYNLVIMTVSLAWLGLHCSCTAGLAMGAAAVVGTRVGVVGVGSAFGSTSTPAPESKARREVKVVCKQLVYSCLLYRRYRGY